MNTPWSIIVSVVISFLIVYFRKQKILQQIVPSELPEGMVSCPHCNAYVKEKNLSKHIAEKCILGMFGSIVRNTLDYTGIFLLAFGVVSANPWLILASFVAFFLVTQFRKQEVIQLQPPKGMVLCPHCKVNVKEENLSTHIAQKCIVVIDVRLVLCPHCNIKVKEENLENHIADKCHVKDPNYQKKMPEELKSRRSKKSRSKKRRSRGGSFSGSSGFMGNVWDD